jgi:hypothetical protein
MKKEIADVADRIGDSSILEAPFNALSNHSFHEISNKIIQEVGLPLSERVFPEWQKWLNKKIKGRKI